MLSKQVRICFNFPVSYYKKEREKGKKIKWKKLFFFISHWCVHLPLILFNFCCWRKEISLYIFQVWVCSLLKIQFKKKSEFPPTSFFFFPPLKGEQTKVLSHFVLNGKGWEKWFVFFSFFSNCLHLHIYHGYIQRWLIHCAAPITKSDSDYVNPSINKCWKPLKLKEIHQHKWIHLYETLTVEYAT